MKTSEIRDDLFRQAVEAVDTGDIAGLKELITYDPGLVQRPLHTPGEEGYFKNPYLIWFVADNPIRNEMLPANVVEVLQLLVDEVKSQSPENTQRQLDYALALVATGRTPRESGKQLAMMDVLIDAGATPGGGKGALANGNIEAAQHLINRGGELTLAVAVGLKRYDDIDELLPNASEDEKITALTLASFFGMADIVAQFVEAGVDVNGFPSQETGFHSHATPLHQAVSSGSIATVRILVEAGAKLDAVDKVYEGTPLGWANHMQQDSTISEELRQRYRVIETYLRSL